MALAKQQIDNCIHGHERCQSSASPAGPRLLPKRLVDCTDPARPRLFSPTKEHSGYVALSYVWGEDQVHKTTTSNLSTYEHGITPSLLPATIRDAIRLTHMLGFRALWVDSLCIIQDSDEDKLHEIGRMHHIYRYAPLTIIAASAERASEGFLYKRPPPADDFAIPFICPPRPPIFQAGHRDAHPLTQSKVGQVYLSSVQRCESFRSMFGRMATRSWCLQEYLMSPRSLIFTPKAVLFRCCTAMVDVQVGHSPDISTPSPRLPDALFLAIPPTVDSGTQEWKDIHRAWNEIVQDYSERTAGDELDKLVACAAIAESFHHVLDSDYLAGLWRSDALLTDLLWSVRQDRLCTRPTVYRAPSWSWASVEGSIEHFPPELTDPVKGFRHVALAEVVDCRVTLEDPMVRFGRVRDGTLVLRGTPIPCCGKSAKQNKLASARSWNVPVPSLEEARCQQWGFGDSHSDEEDGLHSLKPTTLTTVDVHVDCDAEELPGRLWVVPFVRSEFFDLKTVLHNGMVLELAPPSNDPRFECENRRFRRIGQFQDLDFPFESDEQYYRGTKRAALEHLWNPLTRAVQNRDCPYQMDIVIV
ncbi:HET-domain-containing protein [Trametes versicolor FP-101664 SS1]|uniref:HET-domain-containing protein n=1 Tax=Trametes versicolor (strain FP-101664) TaxID=717944 RepID=UPI000462341C|nr:HET-domain-containing protein [Trametes versicolor FP-101664 SS1]EIW59716.1 HET-domain-containing protein [Trametes versicolor FP-101664 SS1]